MSNQYVYVAQYNILANTLYCKDAQLASAGEIYAQQNTAYAQALDECIDCIENEFGYALLDSHFRAEVA